VISAAERTLTLMGTIAPKIAVGGLNPHAGEGGLFGREEIDIIKPAIDAAVERGIAATGPFGADTMFHMQGIDAFVVMLHDQGHIAAKLLARDATAALTIGSPILFSSVAHGSARHRRQGRRQSESHDRSTAATVDGRTRSERRRASGCPLISIFHPETSRCRVEIELWQTRRGRGRRLESRERRLDPRGVQRRRRVLCDRRRLHPRAGLVVGRLCRRRRRRVQFSQRTIQYQDRRGSSPRRAWFRSKLIGR
jgi:hypothetical protein